MFEQRENSRIIAFVYVDVIRSVCDYTSEHKFRCSRRILSFFLFFFVGVSMNDDTYFLETIAKQINPVSSRTR